MQKKRGFTLIELLVVIAIIGVLAAILIPNILGAIDDARKTTDTNNLKELFDSYVKGTANRPTPGLTGHLFWVSLFVGDGPTGRQRVDNPQSTNIYVTSDACNMLRSPKDSSVMSRDALQSELNSLINSAAGAVGQPTSLCSYAGPKGDGGNNWPDLALSRRNEYGVVGTTGSRGGIGFFDDGFSTVTRNNEASFRTYASLQEAGHNYDRTSTAPMYEQELLTWVADYESAN